MYSSSENRSGLPGYLSVSVDILDNCVPTEGYKSQGILIGS